MAARSSYGRKGSPTTPRSSRPRAAPRGGNGGFIEASGAQQLDFTGTVSLLAAQGHAGTLLLDPENVSIQATGTSSDNCASGTCTPTGDPAQVVYPSGPTVAHRSASESVSLLC
jgi:hypothetical protein